MIFRAGSQTPIPIEGRPFHDLGFWAASLQPGDDAAFELVGRIVSEFGRMEFDLGELCLDLAHAGFLTERQNVPRRFPGLVSKKISFVRQCFDVPGPIYPYRRGGKRFLDRIQSQFKLERIKYAHSAIDLNLFHSQDGIARFSFYIIKEFEEENLRGKDKMLSQRQVLSVYDILEDFRKIQRCSKILRRFRMFMRLRKGLRDAPSLPYPSVAIDE